MGVSKETVGAVVAQELDARVLLEQQAFPEGNKGPEKGRGLVQYRRVGVLGPLG